MKAHLAKVVLMVIFATLPASAWAQRVPHEGSSAVGGDVGAFFPAESTMTTGPDLHGYFEYYLSARNSVRIGVGWANPKFEREHADSVRQVRFGADVLHNWEGGSVHPFVGAGVGAYWLQARDNGNNVGDSRKKLGGRLLGGVEFFTSNTFSVKGEAAYHFIGKEGEFNPSGLLLSIGGKFYF